VTRHDIDCEEALGRLFEFLDHELDADERDAVERHLQTCRSCFSRAGFERRLKGKLRELGEVEPTQAAVERIKSLLQNF
jgi:anti-sigma factor (TIGR02949 family)